MTPLVPLLILALLEAAYGFILPPGSTVLDKVVKDVVSDVLNYHNNHLPELARYAKAHDVWSEKDIIIDGTSFNATGSNCVLVGSDMKLPAYPYIWVKFTEDVGWGAHFLKSTFYIEIKKLQLKYDLEVTTHTPAFREGATQTPKAIVNFGNMAELFVVTRMVHINNPEVPPQCLLSATVDNVPYTAYNAVKNVVLENLDDFDPKVVAELATKIKHRMNESLERKAMFAQAVLDAVNNIIPHLIFYCDVVTPKEFESAIQKHKG